MWKYNKLLLCELLFIIQFLLCGCKGPLQKWVEARGFTYDANYSTENKLGFISKPEKLEPNPDWQALSIKDYNIPDLQSFESRTLNLKSSVQLSEILQQITGSKLVSQTRLAHRSTIKLKNPFYERATFFVPRYVGPGSEKEFKIVDKVLNCGKMEIRIFNKHNENISAELLKVEQVADINSTLIYDANSESVLSGENLYVGYTISERKVVKGQKHVFEVSSEGKTIEDLGIWARLYEIRKKEGSYEADIRLSVYPFESQCIQLSRAEQNLLKEEFALMCAGYEAIAQMEVEASAIKRTTQPLDTSEAVIISNYRKPPVFNQSLKPQTFTIEPGQTFSKEVNENVAVLFFIESIQSNKENENLRDGKVIIHAQRIISK
jgi:hypothetical protein